MSIQAMVWAIKDAPVETAQEAMILTAMADQTNDDGTEFRRSMRWLAPRARCSVSTLHRHMKRMEGRGVIRRGDQSLSRAEEGGAPVVWDLVMTTARQVGQIDRGGSVILTEGVGQDERGVGQSDLGGGRSPVTEGVGHGCDRGSVTGDRQESPSLPFSSLLTERESKTSDDDASADFDAWWNRYPKKSGKIAARKAYAKARKVASAQQLADGLEAYRTSRTVTEGYVKDATRWLNGGHWDDEATPATAASPPHLASVPQPGPARRPNPNPYASDPDFQRPASEMAASPEILAAFAERRAARKALAEANR